jgi:hypothetical protein
MLSRQIERELPGRVRTEFRFYGPLNDFLPMALRHTTIRRVLGGAPAVKDAIEAIGVPHPEIGLIVVNGEPVTFAFRVSPGDRVAVFPPFRSIELGAVVGVAPPARPVSALRSSWTATSGGSPPTFECAASIRPTTTVRRMHSLPGGPSPRTGSSSHATAAS